MPPHGYISFSLVPHQLTCPLVSTQPPDSIFRSIPIDFSPSSYVTPRGRSTRVVYGLY